MNPYTRAFRRQLGSNGISGTTDRRLLDTLLDLPATRNRSLTDRQLHKLQRTSWHASEADQSRQAALNIGAARYLAEATPTIGNLIEYTQQSHTIITRQRVNSVATVRGVALARENWEACAAVRTEYVSL